MIHDKVRRQIADPATASQIGPDVENRGPVNRALSLPVSLALNPGYASGTTEEG